MNFRLTFLLVLCFGVFLESFAVNAPRPTASQAQSEFAQFTQDELLDLDRTLMENRLGRKMSFRERMAHKIAKKQIKKARKRGTARDLTAEQAMRDGTTSFNIGGFLLGLLLGLIGVLIAYIIGGDGIVRSAWIGFGIFLAIVLISVLI